MLSETSVLVERINKAISKKWFQKDKSFSVNPMDTGNAGVKGSQRENDYAFFKSDEPMRLLEERVAGLEKQNNQLLYFINFLIEQMPDLVLNILEGEWGKTKPAERREVPVCAKVNLFSTKSLETPKAYPTPREQNVLELLQKGFCAKEIAHRLFISETTVITHKKHLKEKFKAKNTAELISKANRSSAG